MVSWRVGLILMLLAAGCLVARGVEARDVARSFAELQSAELPGKTVDLFGRDGKRTRGRIVRVTGSEIVLNVDPATGATGERTFPETDVREIRRHRAKWKGGLAGLGVGVVIAAALCRRDGQCSSQSRVTGPRRSGSEFSPMHVTGPMMLASLIAGPVIGRALDRGPSDTIYLAP